MNDTPLAATLGRIASGIFILTVRHGEAETGMLASWVMQAGFEPPALSIALRQGRYVTDWLSAGAPLVVNVVPEGNKSLLRHFARGFEPGAPAFEGVEIERTAAGVAVLPGIVGFLECKAHGHVDSGDHRIFLCPITHGELRDDNAPMVHIRKNGMRY